MTAWFESLTVLQALTAGTIVGVLLTLAAAWAEGRLGHDET